MRKGGSGQKEYLELVDELIKNRGRELCGWKGRRAPGTGKAPIPPRGTGENGKNGK